MACINKYKRENLFCLKCGKSLQSHNKTNYCTNHRYLSESFKESRRNECKKLRAKPEYRKKQSEYIKKWYQRKLSLKNENKVLNSLSSNK